jgi:hypothetical protein
VASKDEICNMSLATIGVNSRIVGVDTEKSNEAIQCRLWFSQLRKLLLEVKHWPDFAGKTVDLQDLGTDSPHWAFRYKYPADCVYAIRIVNPAMRTPGRDQKIPFKVMRTDDVYGKAIYCDMPNAQLEYNLDITDPTLFSATFTHAFVMAIAAHVAMPLRVSPDIVSNAQKQFQGWLAEAVQFSNRESQEDPEPQSEFVNVRGCGDVSGNATGSGYYPSGFSVG